MELISNCSICMNPLVSTSCTKNASNPVGTIACGHVFHFRCIHDWLSKEDPQKPKTCPACRRKAKVYDVIRLFGLFENPFASNEEMMLDVNGNGTRATDGEEEENGNQELKRLEARVYEELAILRTENAALKRDILELQDDSALVAAKLEIEELEAEVERLRDDLRKKAQELIDCRLTVAEFSLLLPKLEEQQRRSTEELKKAITRYHDLRAELCRTESALLNEMR